MEVSFDGRLNTPIPQKRIHAHSLPSCLGKCKQWEITSSFVWMLMVYKICFFIPFAEAGAAKEIRALANILLRSTTM